eukprot:TRINITY_DN21973_c0_g1_i1.p1 TRINITY_DN21973_c0_g1~~TRINITY_DN21973_c0_g1_i1.p1  ORF type:complete len:1008 (-),score=276.40 TRINITY_DN21973_c0_g1_i1:131-3154(-)
MSIFCGPFCGRFRDELQGSSDEEEEADGKIRAKRKKKAGSFFGKNLVKQEDLSAGVSAAVRWAPYMSQISVQGRSKHGEVVMQHGVRLQVVNDPSLPASMVNSIAQLATVHTIELIRCGREEIPMGLPDLDGLAILRMSHNKLTKFDEELAKIKGIERIILDYNQINEIPLGVFGLRSFLNLEVVVLAHNRISILPADFGRTMPAAQQSLSSQIKYLDLSNNFIQVLPDTIAKFCGNLEVLNVSHNKLKHLGSFENLKKLQRLFAGFNELERLPEDIGKCRELTKIRAVSNQIRQLPESILELWRMRGGKLEELLVDKNPLVLPSITTFQMQATNESSINAAFDLFEVYLRDKRRREEAEAERARKLELLDSQQLGQKAAALGNGNVTPAMENGQQPGGAALAMAITDLQAGGAAEAIGASGGGYPGALQGTPNALASTEQAAQDGNSSTHANNYYFGHCQGDVRLIHEIRNIEATLMLLKKNLFVETLMHLSKQEEQQGNLTDEMRILLSPEFVPAQYSGKINVTDLDLYFNFLVWTTKPMFSSCQVLYDKFELGDKGYMTKSEWYSFCDFMPVQIIEIIRDQMWDLMCWRKDDQVRLEDFVAAWHIHDVEQRDPWIATICETLRLDYYDMELSELQRRLQARDSTEASPDLDFDVKRGMNEFTTASAFDTGDLLDEMGGLRRPRPVSSLLPVKKTDRKEDKASKTTPKSQTAEARKAHLESQITLTHEQHLDYEGLLRLQEEAEADAVSIASLSSRALSEGEESGVSDFDAQVFLQQHRENLSAAEAAYLGPVSALHGFEVKGDDDLRRLMQVPPEEFARRLGKDQEESHQEVVRPSPVTFSSKKSSARRDRRSQSDIFSVRQALRETYRSLPHHDFVKLVNVLLRALLAVKYAPRESLNFLHTNNPTMEFSLGQKGSNKYTRHLMKKMGFVMLNELYWVWPSVHLDKNKRVDPHSVIWGDTEVPEDCPGTSSTRLDDMVQLLTSCQRTVHKQGFNGHFQNNCAR